MLLVSTEILALAVLLLLSGFFSSSETIMLSLGPLDIRRLAEQRPHTGERLQKLLISPHRLISSILIGNIFVNVATASIGYILIEQLLPGRAETISIPLITLLLLLFGEVVPKRIGLVYTVRLAPYYIPPLEWTMRITHPLRRLMEALTHMFEPFFVPHGRTLNDEEFETVVDISGERGLLRADEWAMIKSIMHLEDLTASDVMTPRVDLEYINLNDAPKQPVERARASRFAYLPLVRNDLDHVEGVLDVRAFLLDPEHRLDRAVSPPLYLPENGPLNVLLEHLQKQSRSCAVVIDEYGGTAGLITRGDILEEITGDIYDELNKPRPVFQSAGPHTWMVDPEFSLEDLNKKLRLHLTAEASDRLSGWITEHLGRLPVADDTVTAQNCRVTVLQTRKNRIELAQIEKLNGGRS